MLTLDTTFTRGDPWDTFYSSVTRREIIIDEEVNIILSDVWTGECILILAAFSSYADAINAYEALPRFETTLLEIIQKLRR